jgi:hypothetical protein
MLIIRFFKTLPGRARFFLLWILTEETISLFGHLSAQPPTRPRSNNILLHPIRNAFERVDYYEGVVIGAVAMAGGEKVDRG